MWPDLSSERGGRRTRPGERWRAPQAARTASPRRLAVGAEPGPVDRVVARRRPGPVAPPAATYVPAVNRDTPTTAAARRRSNLTSATRPSVIARVGMDEAARPGQPRQDQPEEHVARSFGHVDDIHAIASTPTCQGDEYNHRADYTRCCHDSPRPSRTGQRPPEVARHQAEVRDRSEGSPCGLARRLVRARRHADADPPTVQRSSERNVDRDVGL